MLQTSSHAHSTHIPRHVCRDLMMRVHVWRRQVKIPMPRAAVSVTTEINPQAVGQVGLINRHVTPLGSQVEECVVSGRLTTSAY